MLVVCKLLTCSTFLRASASSATATASVKAFSTSNPCSSTSTKKKIVVFLSSVRPVRMADRMSKYVQGVMDKNGMEPIIFDPLKMKFKMVEMPVHFYEKPSDAPKWLQEANQQIKNADGFLIVTAEYNSFPPPALLNMLMHFPADSYRHRPCGLISYSIGGFGGIRATTLIRPLICELCMIPLGLSSPFPSVQGVLTENGICSSKLADSNTDKLIKELGWYADALKNHKTLVPPVFE